MSVYFDSTPRAVDDASNIAIQLGQASLGGTIGVRVIIDDAVLTTREQAFMAIYAILHFLNEKTWPVS
jgi:hypothetical protein